MTDESDSDNSSNDAGEDEDYEIVRPWYSRLAAKLFPFLMVECPFGNKHWRWERICVCGFGVLLIDDDKTIWHGGVLDMKAMHELQPCTHCVPEHSEFNHQWALSLEEECILTAWREYRESSLEYFGKGHPYRYELMVNCNGNRETILSRTQGPIGLDGTRGMFSDVPRLKKYFKPN